MTPIHIVVNTGGCRWASSCPLVEWWTLWSCISNLIVLYILFLRANFTSNTWWESQTFQHNENLSGLFRRIFEVILIRVNYNSRLLKQNYTTLNYTLHYVTQHYVQIWYHTSRGGVIENAGNALKFSEGDIAGVSSHNLKYHCKYFV